MLVTLTGQRVNTFKLGCWGAGKSCFQYVGPGFNESLNILKSSITYIGTHKFKGKDMSTVTSSSLQQEYVLALKIFSSINFFVMCLV